jgi:hypothetical protein
MMPTKTRKRTSPEKRAQRKARKKPIRKSCERGFGNFPTALRVWAARDIPGLFSGESLEVVVAVMDKHSWMI